MMKICKNCGGLATFDSYFGAYICEECGWRDNTYDLERIKKKSQSYDFYEKSDIIFETGDEEFLLEFRKICIT